MPLAVQSAAPNDNLADDQVTTIFLMERFLGEGPLRGSFPDEQKECGPPLFFVALLKCPFLNLIIYLLSCHIKPVLMITDTTSFSQSKKNNGETRKNLLKLQKDLLEGGNIKALTWDWNFFDFAGQNDRDFPQQTVLLFSNRTRERE